ncbi:helix-turn-helix transcriptional regulator [Phascolarctobacterium succinatutens]|uniref:helix-turn-helix transcriptional regulator n=1 Tax=Phascolarctobacterium succinatutens TaxID=626940 RepID=UPI003AEFA458
MTSTSKLKVRRVEMGLKQKELAEVANVSIAYMARLENGKAKNPSIEIMKKLANALKTTPQELFF